MHERVRPFLTLVAALSAVAVTTACSAVRLQPSYPVCDGGGVSAGCVATAERVEVIYEAHCRGDCQANFSLPMANMGAESFSGDFRRRVTFTVSTMRSVTVELDPEGDSDTVTRARILVEGESRAWLDSGDVRPGRTVSLSTVLSPRGGS